MPSKKRSVSKRSLKKHPLKKISIKSILITLALIALLFLLITFIYDPLTGSAVRSTTSDKTPPTITIQSPLNGSSILVGSTMKVRTAATDNRRVSEINMYINNVLVKRCRLSTSCQYSFTTKIVGAYSITANAKDSAGNIATAAVTAIVSPVLVTSCTAPLTETQTLSCDLGYTGAITQTRTKGLAPDCTWGAWTTTSDTCVLIIPTPNDTSGGGSGGSGGSDGSSSGTSNGSITNTTNTTSNVTGNYTTTNNTSVNNTNTTSNVTVPISNGSTNEPLGMTKIAERNFNSLNEAPWSDVNYWGTMDIASDTSSPTSPNNVGRVTYSSNLDDGQSAATSFLTGVFGSKKTIYYRQDIKLSSNWVGHPTTGNNKLIYFHRPDASIMMIMEAVGSSSNSLYPTVYLLGLGSDYSWYPNGIGGSPSGFKSTGPTLGANLANTDFTRGEWHRIEFVIYLGTAGNNDGTLDMWIDGVQTHRYTGIQFFKAGTTPGFGYTDWDPIWGGNTGATPGVTMYQYTDNIYVSGK